MTASAFVFLIIATSVVKINDFNRLPKIRIPLAFRITSGTRTKFLRKLLVTSGTSFSGIFTLFKLSHPFVMSIITIYSLYRNCLKKLIISDFYFIILIGISRNLRFL